jgi:hypothetical protein
VSGNPACRLSVAPYLTKGVRWEETGDPDLHIFQEVLEILAYGRTVQEATAEYFASIHPWFPIISRKRITIGTALQAGGPDLALLFLAMKLVVSQPIQGVGNTERPIYVACKRFLSLLESAGTLSLPYLQAMVENLPIQNAATGMGDKFKAEQVTQVLVALYELGHAIYPAAWMTVGACSRYADILGFPSFQDTNMVLKLPVTLHYTHFPRR